MKVKTFADEIYVLFDISNNDARLIIRAYMYKNVVSKSLQIFKILSFFLFFKFYIKISVYDDYKDISLYYQLYVCVYIIHSTKYKYL
jgi:hypothetical protein